jgi:hypothetical protein
MFFAIWPIVRLTRYRVSTSDAVSKSSSEPSTAAASAARGAGIGAPRSCLRRFAAIAGSIAAIAGLAALPPGISKPLTSHGLHRPGVRGDPRLRPRQQLRHRLHHLVDQPDRQRLARANFVPGKITFVSAFCSPNMRTSRVIPPAPGNSPSVTSGCPI